jgi:hypothetical protein
MKRLADPDWRLGGRLEGRTGRVLRGRLGEWMYWRIYERLGWWMYWRIYERLGGRMYDRLVTSVLTREANSDSQDTRNV